MYLIIYLEINPMTPFRAASRVPQHLIAGVVGIKFVLWSLMLVSFTLSPLQEDGVKSASKQQQQKKQEEAHEEICPVKAIKRILRHATPKELERLEVKVQQSLVCFDHSLCFFRCQPMCRL